MSSAFATSSFPKRKKQNKTKLGHKCNTQMRKWKSLTRKSLTKEGEWYSPSSSACLSAKQNACKSSQMGCGMSAWISPLLQPSACAGGCTSADPSDAKPLKGDGAGPASAQGWERSLRGPSLARGCVPQRCHQLTVCAGSPQHAHPATVVSHTPTPDTFFNHLAFWRS